MMGAMAAQAGDLASAVGMVRQLAGGNPQGVIDQMIRSGATCTLPNGSVVTVAQLADMARGRSPEQMFSMLGPQYAGLYQQMRGLM